MYGRRQVKYISAGYVTCDHVTSYHANYLTDSLHLVFALQKFPRAHVLVIFSFLPILHSSKLQSKCLVQQTVLYARLPTRSLSPATPTSRLLYLLPTWLLLPVLGVHRVLWNSYTNRIQLNGRSASWWQELLLAGSGDHRVCNLEVGSNMDEKSRLLWWSILTMKAKVV